MSDNFVSIIGWLCSTIIVVSLIGGIVYYNLEADKEIIKYITTNNFNPMIIECMDSNTWRSVDTYEICKNLAANPKIDNAELD